MPNPDNREHCKIWYCFNNRGGQCAVHADFQYLIEYRPEQVLKELLELYTFAEGNCPFEEIKRVIKGQIEIEEFRKEKK